MALSPQDISFLDKLRSKGYSSEDQQRLLNQARQKKGLAPVSEEIQGTGKNFALGFTRGIAGAGLLAGQISRLAPGDQSTDPNSFYNRYKGAYEQTFAPQGIAAQKGFAPESTAATAGEFTAGALMTAPLSMGTTSLAQLGLKTLPTQLASKVSPFVSLGSKPTLGNLAKFGAFEGAKDQAIYDFTTQGETSPTSVALGGLAGGVLGPAIGIAGRGLSKTAQFGRELPSKLSTGKLGKTLRQEAPVRMVENNLNFNPTQIEKFKKDFKVGPGEYLLQNNLAGKPKEELFDIFNQKFSNAYRQKTEMLKPINQRYKNPEIDEMIDIISRNVQDNSNDMARADFDAYMNGLKKFKDLKQYTLKDTVDILREFDNWLKIYDAKGFVKGTGANKSLAGLRDRVSSFVDNEARKYGVDIAQMNKDIRISKQFQDGLFRSIIKDDKNNLLGLNDLLLGNLLSGGDPFTGLAVTLAKKGITGKMSTVLPQLSQKIYKYYGEPISGTPLSRTSRNSSMVSPFASGVRPVGGTPVENLPAPSGMPLSPKKGSGTYSEVIPQGKQKVLPDNPIQDITPRSKIVQPGTYTEKNIPKTSTQVKAKLPMKETPKTPQVDTELASLQKQYETLPGVPKVEVPADYVPKNGLPTGTEFESTVLPAKTKTNKIPSPDVKRPQIRGIDLGMRSNMIDSLKQEGIFTDSFFAITDKNLSKKFIDYAEQKAIKKGISTSGKEVSMSRLLDTAKKSADTVLTPTEYVKGLDGDKGIYLRFDISDGNKVAINSSYADIFFKNFDDVTFKGSNEVSPVIVYSKGKDVGVIMPIKDPYGAKEVLGDFAVGKPKIPTPKTPQVEGKTVEKIKAMQLEQEDMIRKGESISEDFRNKWNDLQSQYKKEFIDSRIASERKKVDSAIRDIETKIKENPSRTDWGKKQIQMEEEGFNRLKKGDYFEKKYQEHISKIREEAKNSSLLKSVKNKPSLPLSQKSEVKEAPKTPQVEGETLEQGTFGGVKGVQPKNQAKFNQGDNFEPVRVVMNDKDARIVRYGAIRGRGLKKGFTSADNAEMKGILDELNITREEAINRSDEIKKLAREARSAKEEVILDLTKKPSLPLSSKSEVKYSKPIAPEKAIKEYTNDSTKINKAIRSGDINEKVMAIDKFLEQQPTYDMQTYRGLTKDADKVDEFVNKIKKEGYSDEAYTSSSKSYGDALTFSRTSKSEGKVGIILEIEGKNGKIIPSKYNAYNEEEVIYPRGSKFEFVEEYNRGGQRVIILKQK